MNERRAADSAVALQSETTFRCAGAPMCVADASARVVATNAAFDARFGPCRNRSIPSLFVDPSEQARAAAQLERILEDGSSAVIRGAYATPERRLVLSWSCRAVNQSILAVVENLTDQVTAEDELGQKRDELEALLDALPDTYVRLDRVGRIAAWHPGRETELQDSSGHVVGRRCEEILPAGAASTVAAAAERARSDRLPLTIEYTLATASGEERYEARLVPLRKGDVAGVIRKMTAPRRAEAALRTSEERLRAPPAKARDSLAGGVAHEFNNLLTVILGQLQFLRRSRTLNEADSSYVDEAFEATEHAVSLTRQLIALSRGRVTRPRVFSAERREAAIAPPPESHSRAASLALADGGKTVFVVEDEDGLRRLVVDILERAGYRVLSAADGEEALRTVAEDGSDIDLLLTDLVMPRMNGQALAARIASICPKVRVLLMSGCGSEQVNRHRSEGVERALPVLEKPFVEETLLRKIRDALQDD